MFPQGPILKFSSAPFFARGLNWLAALKFLALLLVFISVAADASEPKLPNYFIRSWKTDNGLPDNGVTAVVQTRDGYLWIGTYGGLVRFDGVDFTVFNSASTPGLQSDRVTSLYEDAQGTLWIGHERGDLTRYRDGKFESEETHATGARRKISAIGADEAGDIWMLNEEGTLVRARDGATCALPNHDGVVEMARDNHGKLWITSGGQLASLEHGRLMRLTDTNNSNGIGYYVEGICASRDGGLWITSDGQVKKWNGHVITASRGPNPANPTLVSMLETKSGVLAMGTSDDGLYLLFSNRMVLHFDHSNGFPNDWIRCLQEDREGTLWVGTGNVGLIALRPGKIETLDAPDHWQGRVVLSTTTSRNGAIWVGSEGAGLYRLLDNQWKRFAESAGFSNLYAWCVSEDAQGRMWAGTWGGGMYRQQGDHFVVPPGLENVNVPMPSILQTPDGVTWIGTASGLIRYENGAVKSFGEKDGLKVPDVRAILKDPDGTIWFGMLGGGLGRLQNGRLKQFLKPDGLSSDYVQCLHEGADGALWIGTYGSGLDCFKNGHFSKVTSAEGLPNNFICAITEDAHDNFWISSHGGIFRVSQKALEDCADGKIASVNCLAYGKGDGMPSLECSGGLQPATCKLADGRICFPTSKGLIIVNPDDTKINHLPPPVVIEDVVAGGHTLLENPNGKSPLKIPPGFQRFEFHYAGLSFVAPEKMQFQYRLEGWEKDWVDAGNKRLAEYSYIPPGNYTFHVRAANSDGIWNKTGASLSLIILPYFWQTFWFRLLAWTTIVALSGGIVWFDTRRRMRRKLERLEHQRDIERERSRIARDIHDDLGAHLTRITMLSESVRGELGNSPQTSGELNQIYDTARELTRSMDEIVWAVNPKHDTLESLTSYLEKFAQDLLATATIRCRLDLPVQFPEWRLTAEVRHNVFLAFKEALHNVVRHAAATEVRIVLTLEKIAFELSITDDGRGFAPHPEKITADDAGRFSSGNGLENMIRRLREIGGSCEIQTAPGRGTKVIFKVLLKVVAA